MGRSNHVSFVAPHRSPSLKLLPEPSSPLAHYSWKNCLLRNQSLMPKSLGTTAVEENHTWKV